VEVVATSPAPRGGAELATGEVLARPTPRPRPATATPLPESALLERFYDSEIRLWLDPNASRRARLAAVRADALFKHLHTILPPDLHETVGELEAICTERRQLADQERLHVVLHGWLLVHAPASMALLLLSGAHAVMALRY
jgi:hypothetical protein